MSEACCTSHYQQSVKSLEFSLCATGEIPQADPASFTGPHGNANSSGKLRKVSTQVKPQGNYDSCVIIFGYIQYLVMHMMATKTIFTVLGERVFQIPRPHLRHLISEYW